MKLGANSEVTRSIIQNNVHIHSGFVGDSIIDFGVRIGAGIITANKKIDRGEINTEVKSQKTSTGLNSLGCIIGRDSKIGVGVKIMPGVLIGANTIVGPGTVVQNNISSDTKYYTIFKEIVEKRKKFDNYFFNPDGKKSKIKAVFFDADKTLYSINTERAYYSMYEFIAEKTGLSMESLKKRHTEEIKKLAKTSDPKKRDRFVPVFNIVKDEKIANEAVDIFWDQIVKDLKPFENVKETISALKKNGFLLVVTSDEFVCGLKRKLNKIFDDYTKYFDCLVTPETVGIMKPSPKYYNFLLEKYSIKPEEVVVVGDSCERDLVEAKKLGITTVLFRPTNNTSFIDNPDSIKRLAL